MNFIMGRKLFFYCILFGTLLTSEMIFSESPPPSTELKLFIDQWIQDNNLNEFGDPQETMYMGGNPLFDESTGEVIDRYQYIIRNHPTMIQNYSKKDD